MKENNFVYLLVCITSSVLLIACKASYVRDVSGGSVNTCSSVLSGNQTTIK